MHQFLKHTLQVVCFIGLLMPASPAAPQTATPEALAAARELAVVMRLDQQMKAVMPNILLTLKSAISGGNPMIEQDYDRTLPLILDVMNSRMREFVELTAGVYAQNFTADELKELTAFYRQPIGQKMVDRMPVIAQQSMAVGQAFGQKLAAELQARMIQELRKKGHKI